MPDLDDLKPLEKFVGDTGLPLELVVRDEDGEPVDLTVGPWTATGGTIRFRHTKTQAVIVGTGTLSISDPANGEVLYQWASADVGTEGLYDVLLRLDTTGASKFVTLQWSRQLLVNSLPAP